MVRKLCVVAIAIAAFFAFQVPTASADEVSTCDAYYSGPYTIYIGTNADNTHYGSDAKDCMFGKGGHDVLLGDDDRDRLSGGDMSDTLQGGLATDFIEGNNGDDFIYGGGGADSLWGNAGNDTIDLGDDTASDVVIGGDGFDEACNWNPGDAASSDTEYVHAGPCFI